jgi:hypothetical protein
MFTVVVPSPANGSPGAAIVPCNAKFIATLAAAQFLHAVEAFLRLLVHGCAVPTRRHGKRESLTRNRQAHAAPDKTDVIGRRRTLPSPISLPRAQQVHHRRLLAGRGSARVAPASTGFGRGNGTLLLAVDPRT